VSGIWLISYVALWILVIVLIIIVLDLTRQLGLIYLRLGSEQNLLSTKEGLGLGATLPAFEAEDVIFNRRVTQDDWKDLPTVLLFISPTCSPCHELMPHLKEFQSSRNGKTNIVMISQGDLKPSLEFFTQYQLKACLFIDKDGKLSEVFHVRATPYAYRFDEKGIVRKRGIVNNLAGLEELMDDFPHKEAAVELPKTR
jgi:methylamine dehydrogenase accessory protein MauD